MKSSEFGLGKSAMVCAIEEEASEAIERLRQCCEADLLIDQNFNIPIFNIIWRIAANRRYNVSVALEKNGMFKIKIRSDLAR